MKIGQTSKGQDMKIGQTSMVNSLTCMARSPMSMRAGMKSSGSSTPVMIPNTLPSPLVSDLVYVVLIRVNFLLWNIMVGWCTRMRYIYRRCVRVCVRE